MNVIGFITGISIGVGGILLYKMRTPKLKTKGTADEVVQYFLSKGFSLNQAVGIAGNIKAESNFNSLASGDSGSAFGIAQWRKDRLQNLKRFSKDNNINYKDFNSQLAFIAYELQHHEKLALTKLKQSNTLESATINFAKYYERPQASLIPKRVNYSNLIMKNYI